MLLRSQQAAWLSERAQLIEKTDVAKTRIERMLGRLKELDEEL
jgi:cell division protein ZapB